MSDPSLSPEQNVERQKRLRSRNIALGIILAVACVVFYIVTLVKGVPLITNRPM